MTLGDLARLLVPGALRPFLRRHRELLAFAVVGGTTFVIDTGIWYALKLTIMASKPVTAGVISSVIATILSYVLNREWSFRARGGRERYIEAALFFLISGVAVAINQAPLYVSRYLLDLQVPDVGWVTQEAADFTSKSIVGVLLAMVFRFWALRKWAFPDEHGRVQRTRRDAATEPSAPSTAVALPMVSPPDPAAEVVADAVAVVSAPELAEELDLLPSDDSTAEPMAEPMAAAETH